MDPGSLFIGLGLLALVAAVILYPLLTPSIDYTHPTTQIDDLLLKRDNILAALRDLDFDHATGKLDNTAHTAQRRQLMDEGITILKQLEQHGVTDTNKATHSHTLDATIERAIAARRKSKPAPPPPPATTSPGHCPNCQAAIKPTDNFCAACGTTLQHPETN